KPLLSNALDSFSYALGLSMGGFYKQQGIDSINIDLVKKALEDADKDSGVLDDAQINSAIVSFMETAKSRKAAANKKLGQDFLDSNKTDSGVVALPSGLQYKVI